jgi:PPOX class probable FMN-dependent enzyme
MPFADTITDVDALRALYREPHELVLRKQIDHIDAAARAFIAASPFAVLATASDEGTDASPRGGPTGFVAVLDDNRLALGDLAGNNRLDTHTNLLAQPRVGMLFLVPGVDETLRVNGRACLTTDPAVLAAVAIDGRVPKVAVGIDVQECFIHCAKAFRRSRLWDASSWPGPDEQPSAACALRDHLGLDVEPEVIVADLEAGYAATMWEPGADR